MRPSNGWVGQQALQGSSEVHGLVEHFLHQRCAVGHVTQNNRLGTGHQRELESFGRVAVGANGDLVHAEIGSGHVCALGQQEETAGCLAVHAQREGGVVSSVVDTVNGTGDKGGLATKHVEGRLGEAVVNVAVVGHVDLDVPGVVSEFKVKPNATDVTSAEVGGDGVEAEQGVLKRGLHAVLGADAGGLPGRCDLDGRRFTAVVLDDRRHGRDRVAEFAPLQHGGIGVPLQVWNVDHGLATAHGLPYAVVDLHRTDG